MPHISVIIPVYNASAYIEACLASLVAQTMDDIELLLIDDHGHDDSMERARRFINSHPSGKAFRFLATPSNSGPGLARNVGIEEAQGEYVCFVDSDDIVASDYCEQLYKAAQNNNADIAYCQAILKQGNTTSMMTNPIVRSGIFSESDRHYFLTHYVTMMWTYIYRRAMLNEYAIRFPSTRSAEDSYFLTCALLTAQRIACVDKPLYHYLLHEESLSKSRNPKRYLDKIKSFDLLMQFAHKHDLYKVNKDELDYIYLKKGHLLGVLTYIYNEEHPQVLTVCKLHNHLLEYVPDYKSNPYYHANRKLRLLHTLIRQGLRLAFKVLPWYIRKTKMSL